jgi:hypothetical protein
VQERKLRLWYTPHKKKSQGVKSGLLGGQQVSAKYTKSLLYDGSCHFVSVMSRAMTWCWHHDRMLGKKFSSFLYSTTQIVSTTLTVLILHNVESVYFFYGNPII